VLLLPGTVRAVKFLAFLMPKTEFREAFAYVKGLERPGDVWWVSFPEVHELYYGRSNPCLGCYTPVPELAAAARGHRVWVIAPTPDWLRQTRPDVAGVLDTMRPVRSAWKELRNIQVLLYEPVEQSTMRGDPIPPLSPEYRGEGGSKRTVCRIY
jgi:hypothetical protein